MPTFHISKAGGIPVDPKRVVVNMGGQILTPGAKPEAPQAEAPAEAPAEKPKRKAKKSE